MNASGMNEREKKEKKERVEKQREKKREERAAITIGGTAQGRQCIGLLFSFPSLLFHIHCPFLLSYPFPLPVWVLTLDPIRPSRQVPAQPALLI